jgi:hypothetical protein
MESKGGIRTLVRQLFVSPRRLQAQRSQTKRISLSWSAGENGFALWKLIMVEDR